MNHSLPVLFLVSSLIACSNNQASTAEQSRPTAVAAVPAPAEGASAEVQVVAIKVTEDGFVPNHIEVKRNQKTTLRFTRTADKTCATAVVFPELKLEKPLPLNQSVDVEVPSDKAQTLTFQCGMGMYKSKVVVK